MRQIMQGTNLQLQAQTKDIERLDQLVENLRNAHLAKSEAEIDVTKKLLSIERETTLHSKQFSQDVFELKQGFKDHDLHVKAIRN